jgi:hypothetical protein
LFPGAHGIDQSERKILEIVDWHNISTEYLVDTVLCVKLALNGSREVIRPTKGQYLEQTFEGIGFDFERRKLVLADLDSTQF